METRVAGIFNAAVIKQGRPVKQVFFVFLLCGNYDLVVSQQQSKNKQ